MPRWEGVTVATADFTKDPDDRLDYSFDWSSWLANSETISTLAIIASPGITVDGTTNTNTITTVWLLGGQAGFPYTVTHRITTNQGRQVDRTMTIRVQNQ